MSDVKRLEERLECMLFRVRFHEELDELKPVSDIYMYMYIHVPVLTNSNII